MLTYTRQGEDRHSTNRLFSSSTSSSESWSTATRWLSECLENHDECARVSGSSDWIPTRLLDVGAQPADLIRLVDGCDLASETRYTTLSHIWGKAEFIHLTRDSCQTLTQGIAFEFLPLTFQHAVEVTRRLHVRYLWIDSLCISQDKDDSSDWLREAQLMDKVYSYSFCNISATGAADSSEGLFVERDTEKLQDAILDLPSNLLDSSGATMKWALIDIMYLYRELDHAALHHRAWVMQERFLSPRVLHFGKRELMWECRSSFDMESGLSRVGKKFPARSFKTLYAVYASDELRPGEETAPDSRFLAYKKWATIVKTYSQCLLTKPEDKLIALSGIAKSITSVMDDTYVAGMWQRFPRLFLALVRG